MGVVGDICTKLQRSLEVSRLEGVVNNQEDILMLLRDFSHRANIDHFECRVGWSLYPDHLGVRTDGLRYLGEVGECRGSCQPAGEGHGVLGPVQGSQALLKNIPGRIPTAAILVLLKISRRVLLESC